MIYNFYVNIKNVKELNSGKETICRTKFGKGPTHNIHIGLDNKEYDIRPINDGDRQFKVKRKRYLD